MITIFNRAELIMTYNIDEQARVRSILADNHIDYRIKVYSPSTASGQRRSSAFIPSPAFLYEYRIFVRKQDLDYALHLIQSQR